MSKPFHSDCNGKPDGHWLIILLLLLPQLQCTCTCNSVTAQQTNGMSSK